MSPRFNPSLIAVVSGFLFALGLGLGGMTSPQKVIGFLDPFRSWDPSLMFVMAGAIAVHMPFALWMRRGLASPKAAGKKVDGRLVGGAALFGVGWGLGGFCPGPAIVSVASGGAGAIVFVVGMLAAMLLQGRRA